MHCINIFGFDISAEGVEFDVRNAWERMKKKGKVHSIACANPHSLVVADTDDEFRYALESADLLLPDGAGIILAAKLLGQPIRERVAGSEFFLNYSKKAQQSGGIRYFFLGSTEPVLEKIVARLNKEFADIDVCGVYSPPFEEVFTDQANRKIVATINQAKPDVLWVGMTAPKQEKWIEQNRTVLNVPMVVAVGAVFDFYAGTKKRAPKWLCDIGLEWLPRLLREPQRLWRRNFVSTPKFLIKVLVQKYNQTSGFWT